MELSSEGGFCLLLRCLCSLWYVRCVPFLCVINQTEADHNTLGCGPRDKMRSILWSLERRRAWSFSLGGMTIFLSHLPSDYQTLHWDSWHYLQPVSSLITVCWGLSGSSRVMALCLMLGKDVYLIGAILYKWNELTLCCVRVTDDGTSLLPPASVDGPTINTL